MCQALCYCFVNVNTFNLEMKGQRERPAGYRMAFQVLVSLEGAIILTES